MSDSRPKVSPQLIAAIIDSAPDRVRRRLDRSPTAANEWEWNQQQDGWSIDTGGEQVTLPADLIEDLEQLSCSCLLAPNCFHVLACLSSLQVADSASETPDESREPAATDESPLSKSLTSDFVQPSPAHRKSARAIAESIGQLLRVGVANAGVVVQSGLLRAVHQCRAQGLHRAATLGLRAIAGVSQFRSRSNESDPAQLAEDIASLLEVVEQILTREEVSSYWIGMARRKQFPVRPRKLHGLLAEPIVTRSGFAGAAAYFLGEDDCIYSASDVRPGGPQFALDAYLGGIEVGSMIQPAKALARGLYLGTDMTASHDGRLGRGKSIKIVDQGQSSWQAEAIQKRFHRPLGEQWNTIYASAALPDDVRPAGWDFIFFSGVVLGAFGPQLLFQTDDEEQLTLRLGIENENAELRFRDNLRMLAHAPGLRLQIIGRLNLLDPCVVFPLALAMPDDASSENEREDSTENPQPAFEIPEALNGRVFLGLDEIQRHHLLQAQATPMVLPPPESESSQPDPLASLRRRWIASMLAGESSQRQTATNTMAIETAALKKLGFTTGAGILDALTRAEPSGSAPTSNLHSPSSSHMKDFLAAGIYLRSCRHELAKSLAKHSLANASSP